MIKRLFLLIILITIISCGYRMVGFENAGSTKYKYYLKEIVNNSNESDYYGILKESVEMFFTNYNSLSNSNNFDYFLFVSLNSVKTSSTIKSATNQTISANMTVTLNIKLLDKNEKVVFNKTMSSTDSYKSTSNVSENIDNKNKAFKSIIQNILSDFKYEFEK